MRIPRFYIQQTLHVGETIDLPQSLHRHATQVLRLKPAEALILFNGKGGECYAQIEEISKKQTWVRILSFDPIERELPYRLTLAQCLIKPEKMDFCIQKSVELGVSNIQPLTAARTVVRLKANQIEKKMDRWKKIIINACEQSGRTQIPQILPPTTLTDWVLNSPTLKIMMSPTTDATFSDLTVSTKQGVALLVGAEGGFTNQEIEYCEKNEVASFSFGNRILRAETAAITGLSLIQSQLA